MHKSVRARRITGRGKSIEDKTAVMGLLERGGQVRTQVIPQPNEGNLAKHCAWQRRVWYGSLYG